MKVSQESAVIMHSRFNRVMAILLWLVAASLALSAPWEPSETWRYPTAGILALFAWAALWRPYVGVDDFGVTLRNVSHVVRVPWPALVHVDTHLALTLHTAGGAFAAWSAPAPGALSSAIAGRRPGAREARAAGGAVRRGDLLGTESGNAALVIREQWQTRLSNGTIPTGVADSYKVTREPDFFVIGLSAVLIAATIWTLTVAH